eukprot:CAMPEP_0194030410 /NCGR_PEP_ID=MMETSP0009_2-20130614/3907_1 /TAXON_ID=210454 /ORGANISM="Grammatophora oceanica, Strain CCMP 410" /LENGTH=188 /DNA_ID=CAMNT_0038670353 /DNA_START=127 /DNA_END=693 /DNA_ORIENTATION=+
MSSETTRKPSRAEVDSKILADLASVKEKMELCDSMLHPGDGSPAPSLKNNEALLGVIGFLEACAPRMVTLVEAAALGALSEHVLEDCLEVNDRLQKLLADIDTYAFTETPASTTAAAAPPPTTGLEDSVDDLLLDTPSSDAVGKSDDPFGNDTLKPAAAGDLNASDGKMPAAPKVDDFDDFLSERTGN